MTEAPLRAGQRWHAMMPRPDHDEMARQTFVWSLRQEIRKTVEPVIPAVYKKVAPTVNKPGGVMFLDDIPDRTGMEETTSFFFDWMTHNAAEPFLNGWIDTDRRAVAERVGFDRKKAKQGGPQNRYFAFRK